MTTDPHDRPMGPRVERLEQTVDALRQRVAELERALGAASVIEPLSLPAMELPALEVFGGPQQPSAAPPQVPPVPATGSPRETRADSPPLVSPPPLPKFVPQVQIPAVPPAPVVAPSAPRPEDGRAGAREPAPEGPSPLRLFLERLQLWPPSGDDNLEARLGAWWATRLGTLLAVIGVVFLGIYVSRGTPPWVRFAELFAVSVAISGFGLWLERKVERFGAVVFGGGLALLYFCAFAAYAVAPMKIIAAPATAALVQLAAVVVMTSAAVWRRSPVVATMAVGLGYVTAVFSRGDGLSQVALGSSLLLGFAAVWFHRRWRWEAPAFLAMPATYAVGALVLRDAADAGNAPARGWTWLFLAGTLVLFFARDWRRSRVAAPEVRRPEKAFQGLNSSLAVAVGVVAALALYPAHLAEFYFGAAVVLGILAAVRLRQVPNDAVGAVLLAKAAGAVTLGVIEIADGRTTAIALLVQAGVMVFVAHRLTSRILAVGTGIVAVVACGFFVGDLPVPVRADSLAAAGQVGFVLGLALLAVESARRLVWTAGAEWRRLIEGGGALVAGVLGVLAVNSWLAPDWRPALLTALACLFAILAALRRGWGPALAAAVPLLAGNVMLWLSALRLEPTGDALWWNALAVLLPMLAGGVVVGNLKPGGSAEKGQAQRRWLGAAIWALAVVGLALVCFNQWPGPRALLATSGLGLAVLILARRWPERRLVELATWTAACGVVVWWQRGGMLSGGTALVDGATVAVLWLLPISTEAWRGLQAVWRSSPAHRVLSAIQVVAATAVSVCALGWYFHGAPATLACALAAVAAGALVVRPGLARALEASWVFWFYAWLHAGGAAVEENSIHAVTALAGAGVLAWLPVVGVARSARIREGARGLEPWWQFAEPLQNAIAVLLAIRIAGTGFGGAMELFTLVIATGLALAAGQLGPSLPARVGAVVLTAWAVARAFALVLFHRADGWNREMLAVLAVATLAVGLPILLARGAPRFTRATQGLLTRLLASGGVALAFAAFWAQRGSLQPYVTVGWGLVAGAVFVAGLLARSRPHRLLGLIGLALCVTRAFLVDLDSTVHRMIAFVVLGVVLLWVGFSYQRFRHLIGNDETAGPGAEPSPARTKE